MNERDSVTRDQSELTSRNRAEVKFIGLVENEPENIRIFAQYRPGLEGLEKYSHAILLYWFHQRDTPQERETLTVTPRRHPGAPQVGVFSTRSPTRPNPIGLCVVELIKIEDCALTVRGLDAIPGSPVLDIKPYNPRADSIPKARIPEWARKGPPT
jgi:tRNA-Thr(GGU) m(6)t(6)A37 methyltransferase TsaA